MSYAPKGDVDKFMRRVGEKYPWLHPEYEPDDELWQMRAVKARAAHYFRLGIPDPQQEPS